MVAPTVTERLFCVDFQAEKLSTFFFLNREKGTYLMIFVTISEPRWYHTKEQHATIVQTFKGRTTPAHPC